MEQQEFLLLIDGSSLLTTQFYGNLPREIMFAKTLEEKEKYFHKIMMTSTGIYTNGVYGFMRTLLKIIKEQKPTYLAVAWDVSRNTFRRELYPEYKANRGDTLVPLKEQFILCQEALKKMNVIQLMDARYEADDFCGSVAKKFEHQVPVKILTKDNDYLQLVTENTNLWMMHSTAEKTEQLFKKYHIDPKTVCVPDRAFNYTPQLVKEEFGINPENVNSLKGLMGDASDNIKGVAGIGEATAVKLISEYKTITNLYDAIENLDKNGEKQIKEYWKETLGLKRSPLNYLLKESDEELVGKKAALLSEKLATIKCDIDLPDVTLDTFRCHLDVEGARTIFEDLEFHSLKSELDFGLEEEEKKEVKLHTVEDFDEVEVLFQTLKSQQKVAIHPVVEKKICFGVAICFSKEESFYVPVQFFITEDYLREKLKEMIEVVPTIYMMNVKEVLPWLEGYRSEHIYDIHVGAYLLEPLKSSYTYDEVAALYAAERFPNRNDLLGKLSIQKAVEQENEQLKMVASFEVRTAFLSGDIIIEKLKEEEMYTLYKTIEMPLVYCLYEMEKEGVLVRKDLLEQYGKELLVSIEALEKEIYQLTGEQFNINSPKQLGEVLFEKMGLPNGKKTKTGYSTAADILEKLAVDYPVVNKILEYRQLTKLKSTYADGLATYIESDGRIHGTFNQTITATGRISSTEPNLQNIPIRMELGRAIRKVFVPKKDCVFIDADYSQIELRVLAHMSGDESLIQAYKEAQDIHALTASQVFHIPMNEVTDLQRRNAKAVNFGIVYGISAFSLSEDLSITRKEALEYIERYFQTYPKVKQFLDQLVRDGYDNGYVTTLFGRRRPIPELKSKNFMQRSFGERVAMNSPIQGTAADIMKIAMIHVEERLRKENLKSRVILQVHDELLVEAYENEVQQVKTILTEEMDHAAQLSVPLEVDMNVGHSWYETK